VVLDLHHRALAVAHRDDELGAPVDGAADQPRAQRCLVEPGCVLHADAAVGARDEVRPDVDHQGDCADSAASSARTASRNGPSGWCATPAPICPAPELPCSTPVVICGVTSSSVTSRASMPT